MGVAPRPPPGIGRRPIARGWRGEEEAANEAPGAERNAANEIDKGAAPGALAARAPCAAVGLGAAGAALAAPTSGFFPFKLLKIPLFLLGGRRVSFTVCGFQPVPVTPVLKYPI